MEMQAPNAEPQISEFMHVLENFNSMALQAYMALKLFQVSRGAPRSLRNTEVSHGHPYFSGFSRTPRAPRGTQVSQKPPGLSGAVRYFTEKYSKEASRCIRGTQASQSLIKFIRVTGSPRIAKTPQVLVSTQYHSRFTLDHSRYALHSQGSLGPTMHTRLSAIRSPIQGLAHAAL